MTMTLPRTSQLGRAVVDKAAAPNRPGRVKYQGTYWGAELTYPDCREVGVGETIVVVGREGITLLIVPEGYEMPMQPRKSAFDRRNKKRSSFVTWVQKFSFTLVTALK